MENIKEIYLKTPNSDENGVVSLKKLLKDVSKNFNRQDVSKKFNRQ